MVLYAFFLPLSGDIRRAVFFAILLIWVVFYRNYRETLRFALNNKVIQVFVAIFGMYLLWLIGSDNAEQARYFINDAKIYLFTIILFALTQYVFLKRIIAAFFLGMFFNELMSYGIFFEVLPADWAYREKGHHDPSPAEYSHLEYGFALAFTTGMVLFHWLKNRELKQFGHWVLGIFFVTASANIFITGGRVGYVLYAVSLVTVALFLFRHRWKTAVSIAVLVITVAYTIAYTFSPVMPKRVNKGYTEVQRIIQEDHYRSSFGIRVANWIVASEVMRDHWLAGVGSGDHMVEVHKVAEEKYPQFLHFVEYVGTNIHNAYLDIALQFGLIGLLVFGFLLYRIWSYDQPDPQLKIMQYLLIMLVLVMGIVHIWSRNMPGIIFVSMIAFSLVKPAAKEPVLKNMDRNTAAGYIAAAILFAVVAPLT